MPKEYVNSISKIGCMEWVFNYYDDEYRLYHENLGLLITVGAQYVVELNEQFETNEANILWALFGELIWKYFANNNNVAERYMLKRICNM